MNYSAMHISMVLVDKFLSTAEPALRYICSYYNLKARFVVSRSMRVAVVKLLHLLEKALHLVEKAKGQNCALCVAQNPCPLPCRTMGDL